MYENYKGLDIGKIIAAILIVLLHATECSDYLASEIKFTLTRFAVPFFFITSGYFLAKGLENKEEKVKFEYIKKYILKLVKLYVIWALIIYLPFTIYSYSNLPQYKNAENWYFISVLLRKLLIVGPGPFWFILALIGGSIWCYCTRNKTKVMTVTMLFTFLLMILYTNFRCITNDFLFLKTFYKSIDLLYSWEFNFLTYGIPFCSLGYLIRKKKISLTLNAAAIGFILFSGARFVEFIYLFDYKFSISYIPQAICFFYIFLNYTPNLSERLSRKIRSLSSFIYFSHAILLYNILNPILIWIGVNNPYAHIAILPKTVLITLVCYLLYAHINKYKSPIAKLLVNG